MKRKKVVWPVRLHMYVQGIHMHCGTCYCVGGALEATQLAEG